MVLKMFSSGSNSKYFMVCDYPSIPRHMIDPLSIIETRTNHFAEFADPNVYASYDVSEDLELYVKQQFGSEYSARYQVIKQQLPKHIDRGTEHKLNYIISTGGVGVLTRWWDGDDIVEQLECVSESWYNLNVSITHDITAIDSPRVSLVVRVI